jgi:uncharacterized protein (TIGR00369 family)
LEAFEKKVRDSFDQQLFMATLGAEMISVHAGAVTSIMDSACGYAALSVAPPEADVLSVEFKVNLLSPGIGESFVARASVKRAGKRLAVCTADAFAVRADEEKLIATMLATIMNVESKVSPAPGS